MEKRHIVFCAYLMLALVFILAMTMFGVSACSPMKEKAPEIHKTIAEKLNEAYESGGAEKVAGKIDDLVEEGKLTAWQAEKLKEALQTGYEKLQARLEELGNQEPDVPDGQ